MRRLIIIASILLAIVVIPTYYYAFSQTDDEHYGPPAEVWQQLNERVGGRLKQVQSPLSNCHGEQCGELIAQLDNPFEIAAQPWATQSTGWYEAWSYEPSYYVLEAETTQDLVEAVNFAREHHVKLVIKATGHDFLGRSSAPNSLLVWTHKMRKITVHSAFVAQGAPADAPAVSAMSAAAGAMWIDAYETTIVQHKRFVQGGGCTTVGVAGGFLQGGGFGQFARKYGTGASNLLEAEVVLADGRVVVANNYQHPDLFWALKGGGGGTFGIVSKVTLQTYDLPSAMGFVDTTVVASNDLAYKKLISKFLQFYHEALQNETWGEQVHFNPDNTLTIAMSFIGISKYQAQAVWEPFKKWVEQQTDVLMLPLHVAVFAMDTLWDVTYLKRRHPDAVVSSSDQGKEVFYWKNDREQILAYWFAYQSRWMPAKLFEQDKRLEFADKIFQASRQATLAFHFNKGLAGASQEAVERVKQTAMNPSVLDSAALVLIAYGQSGVFPKLEGYEPDWEAGVEEKNKVDEAARLLFALAPQAGTYVNEANYFEENWQQAFWGPHYSRLLKIKRKYDPKGLFICHHCVGSKKN